MSLVVVGDVHGKVELFQNLIHRRTESEDTIIQVGDMGAGFGSIPDYPDNVYWIRGNHDDPAASRAHKNYLGDYGYRPEWKLFYLAGAWSIDWEWREKWNAQALADWNKWKRNSSKPPRKVWWEDEELSQEELDKAVELYAQSKPEVVVSHEAPASIVPHVLAKVTLSFEQGNPFNVTGFPLDEGKYNRPEKLQCIKTRTSEALQRMLDIHRPKYWCFGHYHISKGIDTGSTFFKCCAELEPFRIPDATT